MSDKTTPGAEAMARAKAFCHENRFASGGCFTSVQNKDGCHIEVAAAIEQAVREENEACEQSLLTSSEGWRRGIVQTFAREAARTIAARRRP